MLKRIEKEEIEKQGYPIKRGYSMHVWVFVTNVADAQLSADSKVVETVENPYKKLTARKANKTPGQMCELEVGFEECRQAILKEGE